ncbi:MAG TPA: enolase C-terminal domain-like protein [Methylovirgula sp.]|nr:enolase C-terminal domain-like protein [Methylovirgula sp.]
MADDLQLRIAHLQLPLTVPYRLAFGEQKRFDTILVGVQDTRGKTGWGEATILPGYTDETVEGAWAFARDVVSQCQSLEDVRAMAKSAAKTSPFAATAFLTAIDWLNDHPILHKAGRFPLLGTVNGKAEAQDALVQEIETLLAAGYKTLKVKIGWDVERDLKQVKTVQSIVKGRAKLRIDGNQGYTVDQATAFLSKLDGADVELVEQPCAAGDWDAAIAVKRAAGVPVMLDESIYTLDDIGRAAKLKCADYIKLKLMKLGNLDSLTRGFEIIADCGMTAVIGNGVAADLGCWMEIAASLDTVTTAGEMNGFLKTPVQILKPALRMEGADVVLDGQLPSIDIHAVVNHAVAREGNWPGVEAAA